MISNLPLRYKILLPSAAVLALTAVLSLFLLLHLMDIRQQNEIVREWARAIEQLQGAVSSGQNLDRLATRMENSVAGSERDDIYFNYLEQYWLFSQSLHSPHLLSKLSPDTSRLIARQQASLGAKEAPDPRVVHTAMAQLLPVLDRVYRDFWGEKRVAYIRYYDTVNSSTTRLINSLLGVLGISLVIVVALSFWVSRNVTSRIRSIANQCQSNCAGSLLAAPSPGKKGDEMDELAQCVSKMISRLVHVVSTEKLLEGIEDERRRIAMDLHDHILADLTNLSRDIRSLQMRKDRFGEEALDGFVVLDHGLAEISHNIRCIMDDLHPQTLDMLGVGAALRSYLEKKLTRDELPSYRLYVDDRKAFH